MKKENIVTREWGDRRKGKTDWARVDALTDEDIAKAVASDPDAAAHRYRLVGRRSGDSRQEERRSPFASMKMCSTISRAKAMAISAASTPCCVPTCSRRPSRRSARDAAQSYPLQKPPRGDPRQVGDRPVVEIGPGLARPRRRLRDRQHLPDIFGRLGKTLAAGLVHVELAQQFVAAGAAGTVRRTRRHRHRPTAPAPDNA